MDLQTQVNSKVDYKGPNVTFGRLAEQFTQRELAADQQKRSHTTVATYQMYLRRYIRPQWDSHIATRIAHWAIEDWLEQIRRAHDLAPKTIGHIKQLMGRVFAFAIHRELIPDTCNPVRKVKCSTSSDYTAVVIRPDQSKAILDQLQQPERTLLCLITMTGLRCSEVLGLKWSDIDSRSQAIFVRRSWTMDKIGKPKSKASKAPVPCIPALAKYLECWRKESPYAGDDDWVFPSLRNRGRTPRSGSSLSSDHVKAAAIRAGVIKADDKRQFGTHNLRHSLATSLISWGVDIKTVQGTLRHANPQTTLNTYTQVVDLNKLTAQGMMWDAVWENAQKTSENREME
ncbi:MAG: site-specific integrase [Terracidiphilus sp.]